MTSQTYILTFLIFILAAGGYTAMPLFPLLTEMHDITLAHVGTLTAIYIFTQQATPVFLGSLGDYYGYKKISIIGETIRGLGFIGVGSVSEYTLLVLFSAWAGLGGGFAVPALQSLIMKSAKSEDRPKVSALRASATNAGLLIGPLIAGLVIWSGQFNLVFISAGILYLVGAVLLLMFISPYTSNLEYKRMQLSDFIEVLRNKGFIRLIIFMLMFYILYAQLFITIPEYAKQFTNQIQIVFLINGITGLTLQYPVGRFISKHNKPETFIIIGVILITLAFLTIALFYNLVALCLAVFLFAIGGVFILPIIETRIADYSDKSGKMGLYFGVSKLSDGLGRPLGSILGGGLFYYLSPSLTWFILTLFGSLMLLYILTMKKNG